MPRYDQQRFQLGDYWLSKQARSPAWCRTWYDSKTQQTRRVSLRTTDFEQAKQRLTDWFVIEHNKVDQPIAETTLGEVFARFYEHHGKTLKSASDVSRILRYWLDFHKEATVAEATNQATQERFRAWLVQTKQLSPSSVRGVLTVGKSALNWAHKRGEIEQVPYIQLVKVPKPEPKGRPLEIDEVAALFRLARKEHVQVFMAFMLGTASRTSAVLELTLNQIDTTNGLINLNPMGRMQTKKYRPTVKLPDQLMEYAEARSSAKLPVSELVHFNGKPVKSIKTAWSKMRTESGLEGNIQTYSLRHTMARWMRMRSVPAWETAAQLGHKMPNFTTTEIYAPFDPAYLSKSKRALDDFLGEVSCELRVNSMSEFLLNPPS